MLNYSEVISQCGIDFNSEVLQRIVAVESSFNPFAIGIVDGKLSRQPVSKMEAIETALHLYKQGRNFSLGLAQINRYNLLRYGLNFESVFEPCHNLRAAASIYNDCFSRAIKDNDLETAKLKAFSCYYSGNFTRGFVPDDKNGTSYIQRILNVKVSNDSKFIYPSMLTFDDGGVYRNDDNGKLKSNNPYSFREDMNRVENKRLYKVEKATSSLNIKELRGG